MFQDTWRSNKENPSADWNAALSCPFMASNYANSHLVPISFWMLTMPWIFNPISFYRRVSRFVVFPTKVAHSCFCLVRIKMPLHTSFPMPPSPNFGLLSYFLRAITGLVESLTDMLIANFSSGLDSYAYRSSPEASPSQR